MSAPDVTPITAALLTRLREKITRVHDTYVPPNTAVPYAFLTRVYTLWEMPYGGGPYFARLTYQVTCVGLDAAVAENIEARAREAMSATINPPGWQVVQTKTPNPSPGLMVDFDTTPHHVYSTPTWQFWAQPISD